MYKPKKDSKEVKSGPIPKEGYIPDAKTYMIGSASTQDAKLMPIGGRVMMDFMREEMLVEHIISIHGVGNIKCIIIVDYTVEEIMEFMRNVRIKIKGINMRKN